MSGDQSQQAKLVEGLVNEAKRIYEDSIFCYSGHSEEARWWSRITLRIGIPTTIIAAIAGVTSLSTQDSVPLALGLSTGVVAGTLAFLVAAMSGLSTFLDPKGQSSKHYQACISYLRLANDTREYYEIDCLTSTEFDKLKEDLKKLCSRLNDLNDQTPVLSERARRIAEKNVASGRYIYGIDKEGQKKSL